MDDAVKDGSSQSTASRARRLFSRVIAAAIHIAGNRPYAVGIAGTLFALVVVAIPLAVMVADRDEEIAHARETSENLDSIIALDLERNFEFYDVQLQDLVRDVQDLKTWPMSTALQSKQVFPSLPANAYVDGEYVVDSAGRIVASADTPELNPALRVNDRDYFVLQRDNASAGLVISHPFRSRVHDGKLAIALTRRISGPDSSFAGIALFEVRLAFFQRLFDTINVEQPGIVEIVLADGTVLASKPFSDEPVGTSVAGNPVFVMMTQHPSGSIIATGRGNVQRIYTYQHVTGLPFIAVVAPAMNDVLRNWRRQFRITVGAAILWGLVLTAGAWVLAYALRDKLRAQDELARLAATDPLTQLKNRRALNERLQAEWDHAVRDHSELSVLFVDIDRFKLFNDTYGHAAGDEVLATVATCISSAVRRSIDLVARYGGEEFIVVLPATGHDGAIHIAEMIRHSVEILGIPNPASETAMVTVSIGCATCRPSDGSRPEKLVSIADEQLYKAKSSGRNRVRSIVLTPTRDEPAPQG